MSFGTDLKAFREGQGWSISEVEKRTGISWERLWGIEAGHCPPSRPDLQRLQDGIGYQAEPASKN